MAFRVRAPFTFERPVPVRSVKDSELRRRAPERVRLESEPAPAWMLPVSTVEVPETVERMLPAVTVTPLEDARPFVVTPPANEEVADHWLTKTPVMVTPEAIS